MPRPNLNELASYAAVAQERSFTRAAAKLGISPSALSQTISNLEKQLGLRLLTRTTRSVTPTEAGSRLLATLTPMIDAVDAELKLLGELRERPTGTIRISATESAIESVLWPSLRPVLHHYPDINVEIDGDPRLTDIVAQGYDAGVRVGGLIAKDMIAVSIGPDMPVSVVGSPTYLNRCSLPETPQDLTAHRCINLRLPTYGGLYAWEFVKDGRELRVRVEGQLVFNSLQPIVQACLDGFGLAYVPNYLVQRHIDDGALIHVLSDWSAPFPGFQLYFPSRRQPTAAFTIIVDALRYRPPADNRLKLPKPSGGLGVRRK